MSFAQQRLWFLEQLEPGTHVYNLPDAFWLEGDLDVGALERSLAEIVRRHESLRTTFEGERDGPVQVVSPASKFCLYSLDWTARNPEREDVRAWVSERARMPFDLELGPLFRADLIRFREREHALLLNMHHIVSDGWSLGVLHRELGALYSAFAGGHGSPLAELPVQYADYAVWQREQLSGEVLERELAHWRRVLSGAPDVLALPTDRMRPPVQTYQGAKLRLKLSAVVSQEVHRLGQREAATPFMVLMAALQALLGRHAHQQDVVVGTPIANRDRVEMEALIGFFVNTLVLRTDLSGDPTFAELVRRVRTVALEAYAHHELPFEKLVQELSPRRQLSHTPLFQVLFGLRSPMPMPRLDGPSVSRMELDSETAKVDLTLILDDSGPEIAGWLQYNTSLFDAATAEAIVEQLGVLLETGTAEPDRRISQLSLMSPATRHRVLVEWNGTEFAYPRDSGLHELFQRQAEGSPRAVAVVSGSEELTYEQLNASANRLAHHLRALGVGPEVPVGLCLDRSLEAVVAILAIIKAGGAYLPLDPSYPPERLRFMIGEVEARVLVTRERFLDRLPALPVASVCLDRDVMEISGRSAVDPESLAGPENIAYLMYTSGSTGRPKAVMVPHRAVARLVIGSDYARLDEDTVLMHMAPVSFDASTFEIWGALLHGGRCVVPPEVAIEPGRLAETIRSHGVTTAWLTGSLFHALAEEDAASLEGLTELLTGGEALSVPHVRRALERLPRLRLINGYGPTESTTFACTHPIRAGLDTERPTIPIGRPIANTRAYILDASGAPTPPGVRGELYIGGDGLARGYWRQPELTAERFLPDPFGPAGGRLYRTGDLARHLADGVIEFLGRGDHQVKVRGFRVEIGEVEAALSQAPGVRQAAVSSEGDGHGSRRLVAHIVADGAASASAQVRSFLGKRLPDYMIPSRFDFLEDLPLTRSGKVDRMALSARAVGEETASAEEDPPRTWIETVVAGIWTEALGTARFGRLESFFELGGHSLLAASVIARVRKAFGVELGVRQLFDTPTVAGLATAVEGAWASPRPTDPGPFARALSVASPLSFAQERLWFLDRLHPGRSEYNIFEAARLEGHLDGEALRRSIEEIVRRHETLQTRFTEIDGKPLQEVSPAGHWDLPIHDLAGLPPGERDAASRRFVRLEALAPFDLAAGPPFRAALVRLSGTDHILVWAMHHVVSDGWSLGVFRRELAAGYAAFVEGRKPSLPELPVQYRDYAVWQREWLSGEVLEEQLSYWRRSLAGAERLRLPVDHERPATQSGRGSRVRFRLTEELSRRLRELSRREDVTVFMTLLAAFQTLLHRVTGQEDLLIGTDQANRRHVQVEGLIGFFANLLVLRTDLSGRPTFRMLLRRVRETAVGAYAHQDLPFARLVSELRPERTLAQTPIVQALFVQNAPAAPPSLSGLATRPLPIENSLAKFDLAVFVDDGAEGIKGTWRFDTDLFLPGTVRRLVTQFETLLQGVASDPDRPLRELPIEPPGSERDAASRPARTTTARSVHRKGIKLTY